MNCPYVDVCKDLDELLETETDRDNCSPDTCTRYTDIDEGAHLV